MRGKLSWKKGRQCRQPYVAYCNSEFQKYAPDFIMKSGVFVISRTLFKELYTLKRNYIPMILNLNVRLVFLPIFL